MSYQSPITLFQTQMQSKIEEEIYQAIMKVGVDVDKEELLKALAYDRNQYQKGYDDRDQKIVRCKDCKHHGKDTCGAVAGIAYPPPDDWFCADGERSVK